MHYFFFDSNFPPSVEAGWMSVFPHLNSTGMAEDQRDFSVHFSMINKELEKKKPDIL